MKNKFMDLKELNNILDVKDKSWDYCKKEIYRLRSEVRKKREIAKFLDEQIVNKNSKLWCIIKLSKENKIL